MISKIIAKNLNPWILIEFINRWDINHDECNVFNSLKRLTNLQEVNITGSRIVEIPAEAFHDSINSRSNLVNIDLSGGEGGDIAKVGKNAFSSLKGLRNLIKVKIKHTSFLNWNKGKQKII